MVNSAITVTEIKHPEKYAEVSYNLLIGIDEQKEALLSTLSLLMDKQKIELWHKKHHQSGIGLLKHLKAGSPLIILSGEVGCGKTALAQSIGTPLAHRLNQPVKVFETPSNIRGSGLVGEISNRITEVFESTKAKLGPKDVGILIIDEADDLATSRSQNQAHHEDRAGLNVLIKQVDAIGRSQKKFVVIMITNRIAVLDPAVRRRTSAHIVFDRPTGSKLEEVLKLLLEGTKYSSIEFNKLRELASSHDIPYSFSDLIQRIGQQAVFAAVEKDVSFNIGILTETMKSIDPTPLLTEIKLH